MSGTQGDHGEVTLTATDTHEFRAVIATPGHGGAAGSVVLLHEIFGINAYLRTMARMFAEAGYIAIVPDLFARQERDVELGYTGNEFDHAIELRDHLDWDTVILDIGAAISHVRGLNQSNGKVATLGYCLGGGLAVLAAARCDVDGSVSYYGVGVQDRLELASDIAVPVLFHFAEHDHYCPPDARAAIAAAFADVDVSSHLYPGVGHAFATYGRDTFDAAATDLAFARTLDTLERWLTP